MGLSACRHNTSLKGFPSPTVPVCSEGTWTQLPAPHGKKVAEGIATQAADAITLQVGNTVPALAHH